MSDLIYEYRVIELQDKPWPKVISSFREDDTIWADWKVPDRTDDAFAEMPAEEFDFIYGECQPGIEGIIRAEVRNALWQDRHAKVMVQRRQVSRVWQTVNL